MAISKSCFNSIIISLTSYFVISCGKKDCPIVPHILPFEAKYSITPEQIEYKVGDTLFFKSIISVNSVFPLGSDFSELELGSQITCKKLLITDSFYLPFAAMSFNSFFLKGKSIDSTLLKDRNIVNFAWEIVDTNFVVEIGIIPKEEGAYAIGPFSGSITPINKSECNFLSTFFVNYHTVNNHLNIVDSITNKVTGDFKLAGYYFFVKPK